MLVQFGLRERLGCGILDDAFVLEDLAQSLADDPPLELLPSFTEVEEVLIDVIRPWGR